MGEFWWGGEGRKGRFYSEIGLIGVLRGRRSRFSRV